MEPEDQARESTLLAGQAEALTGGDELHGERAVKGSAPARDKEGPVLGRWGMGLVVTASALCGGIAVVLWNRRLLTKMREVAPVKREQYRAQQGRLWEDDV